jgi:Ras-related protein Rab-7A
LHSGIDSNEIEKYPFVLLGNKVDREEERAVPYKIAEQWCQKNGNIPYIETSAKDSTNVIQAFQCAAELTLSQIPQNSLMFIDNTTSEIDLSKIKPTEDSNCIC